MTDLEEAKRQLNEILSQSEFARLRSQTEGEVEISPPVFQLPVEWIWGIYLFIAIVIVTLLIYYGVKLWKKRQANEDPKENLGYSWFAKAQSYALKGEYRFAVRSLFQYLLLHATKQKWIEPHPAKTNGEYRQEVQQKEPVQAPPFSNIAQQFDRTWYGREEITAEKYSEYERKIMQLAPKEGSNES